MVITYDNRYEGVKGTPYFDAQWRKGTLTSKDKVFDQIEIKYNVYENKVLYRGSDGKEFYLLPHQVDSFTLTDNLTTRIFKRPLEVHGLDMKLMNSFFAIVFEGHKTQLLLLPEKNFIKANFKGAYSSGKAYDELQNAQSFYFVDPKGQAQKIKLSKKSLLQALIDRKIQMEAYLKQENVDAGSEAGWVKALSYYETL